MKLRRKLHVAAVAVGLLAVMSAGDAHAQMSVPGSFEVSDTGAATYTIPIAVPPGTAGMQPSLALSYSSQAGNGLLGMGWSLSGLPTVTRCPKTIAQDGAVGGINYDANDRFCLEGQRLIAISGAYGADQTEYRTERESFSQIVSYGTAGTGPSWFKVWSKSGQVMEFGNTADSRIEAQGKSTVRLWAANKISDTKGNYIAISYAEDNADGEYKPSRIDYAGNNNAGITPFASARFTYEARPDVAPVFEAGSVVKTTQRLSNIKTYVGETLVYDYRLAYEASSATGRSRLTTVTLCADGGVCLPPSAIVWQGTLSIPGSALSSPAWGGYVPIVGDFNGDGRADLFLQAKFAGQPSSMWLATAIGGMSPGTTFIANGWQDYTIIPSDFNGDGRTDLFLQAKFAGQPSSIFLAADDGSLYPGSSPFASGLQDYAVIPGDFNGDGRTDIFLQAKFAGQPSSVWLAAADGSLSPGSTPFASGLQDYYVILGDFNGDGRTDIFVQAKFSGQPSAIYFAAPDGSLSAGGSSLSGWETYNIIAADFNGDGKTDLFLQAKSSGQPSSLWLADGTGNLVGMPFAPLNWNDYRITVADFNGDGRVDLFLRALFSGQPSSLWFSNGNGTLSPAGFGPTDWHVYDIVAADWNGDGITDLWVFRPDADQFTQQFISGSTPDLVVSVGNGLGGVSTLAYKTLSQSDTVYAKGSGAAYPVLDIRAPLYVVSEVQASDGIGGNYRSTYRYGGARMHVQGRGFLGFETVTAKDEQTLVEQVTTYLQADPYTGLVVSRVKKLGATTLNETANTYAQTALGGTRSFVYLTQSVEKSWELNGSLVSQVTTTHQYDAYGNATQVAVSTPDGYSKTTTNTYQNDALNWLLGRLTRASVTSVTPN